MPRSLSTLLQKERAIPRTAVKRESAFWKQMKDGMAKIPRKLTTTRLETWALPGVPDLVACDEQGRFHFVELKATAGNAVELRPHQVSWLSSHSRASVWVAVQRVETKNDPKQFFLFHGSKAVDLRFDGLKVEPDYHSIWPPNWDEVWALISPQ